jgi:hypothetical protein
MDTNGHSIILKLEGRLVDGWVALLGETVGVYRERGRSVVLDLAGLRFASPEGVELLRRLERDAAGVRCVACPPFLECL